MPKTRNLYLLSSHARVSNDEKYIRLVEELIEVRKSKDINKYRNRSKQHLQECRCFYYIKISDKRIDANVSEWRGNMGVNIFNLIVDIYIAAGIIQISLKQLLKSTSN